MQELIAPAGASKIHRAPIASASTVRTKHRAPTVPARRPARRAIRQRLPWWVHIIFFTIILGATAASVVTGNPLYGWIGCPGGYALGSAMSTPAGRRSLSLVFCFV